MKLRSGQVLVEMVLALSVLVLSVLAIASVTTKSVSNLTFSRKQSTASGYATAGVEWIRGQRDDLGWEEFLGYSGTYCLNSLDWGQPGDCEDGAGVNGTEFARTGVISGDNQNRQVEVEVKWQEGNRTASIKRSTQLSRY